MPRRSHPATAKDPVTTRPAPTTAARPAARVRRRVRFPVGRAGVLSLALAPGVHEPDPYAPAFAAAMRVRPGDRVLDLGCGAGGYGLAAALRGAAHVVFTDVEPAAVACALDNAARNGLDDVSGRVGSMFAPVRGDRFDVVTTSLPQLPAPRPVSPARYGGPDGLRFLRALARTARRHLEPHGRLYALVTDWAWPPAVAALPRAEGHAVRTAARVERAFQPVEYDRMTPGLFAYLDARARRGLAAYRRAGAWCHLGVSLLEARARGGGTPAVAARPTSRAAARRSG